MGIADSDYEHLNSFTSKELNKEIICSSCHKTTNNIIVEYAVIKVPRKICGMCYGKALDKIFGISDNMVKTEQVLYGDNGV